ALDCGFCDQSHFNRTFKKYTGLTPEEFRNKTMRSN
ncbi:MAG TPA: AraC family transcriptional regulator, partial [Spirochaetota bacterium]|nr:AraC family transcriptional regulator [Spirochaetota bacterium]